MLSITVYCTDIPGGSCCDSCHTDDEEYGYAMVSARPENRKGRASAIYAYVCCGKSDFLPKTRLEWAKLLLQARNNANDEA